MTIPPFSPRAPFSVAHHTTIIYQHNHHFLSLILIFVRFTLRLHSFLEFIWPRHFDTWEHVAQNGSHTWSETRLSWYTISDRDSVLHKAAYNRDVGQLAMALVGVDDIDYETPTIIVPLFVWQYEATERSISKCCSWLAQTLDLNMIWSLVIKFTTLL